MAEEQEVSTVPEAGSGVDNTSTQAAEPTSQEAVQGQDSGQGEVGRQAPSTSSNGSQGRQQNNGGWAAQRVLEKKLERMIADSFKPLMERFDRLENPPVSTRNQPQEKQEIDYNDLPGSINRLVELGIQQRLSKFEKEKLSPLDSQIEEKLSMREARQFLLSQPEINGDEDKMDEVRQLMKDRRLDLVAMHDPVWAIKEAVNQWKSKRKSPNAPPRETLTTITGGAVNKSKAPSMEEMKNLQRVITSDAPEEEKQAAYRRIDELSKFAS